MAITIRATSYADHWGGTPDEWAIEDGDRYLGNVEKDDQCGRVPMRFYPYTADGAPLDFADTLTEAIERITAGAA